YDGHWMPRSTAVVVDRLPVPPEVVPRWGEIAPIAPGWSRCPIAPAWSPSPATSQAAIEPTVAPNQLDVRVSIAAAEAGTCDGEDRLANGGQPLRYGLFRDRRSRRRDPLGGIAGNRGTEQH